MSTTQTPEAPNEAQRALNTGVAVTTAKLGELQVRELVLEQVIVLLADIIQVFTKIPKDDGSGLAWVGVISQDPAFLNALKKIVAASTQRDPSDFDEMGVKDWLVLIVALKKVVDWEEMRDLFFQIVPPKTLADRRTNKEADQAAPPATP